MNHEIELDDIDHIVEDSLFQKGLDKMYEWLEIAMFDADLVGTMREKITKRIEVLRSEK